MLPKGQGKVLVNEKPIEEFFGGHERHRAFALAPLKAAEEGAAFDFKIRVGGGGVAGQAGAIRLGLARALAAIQEKTRRLMRKEGFLTRDARVVERKKAGRPKARKRFQYSKR